MGLANVVGFLGVVLRGVLLLLLDRGDEIKWSGDDVGRRGPLGCLDDFAEGTASNACERVCLTLATASSASCLV